MKATPKNIVYVMGAGLSAGLGFPTINKLLFEMWPRIMRSGISDKLGEVIRFHHPGFNASLPDSFPNVEQLLSEMQANSELFESSRPGTGGFSSAGLDELRKIFLLELTTWFHEIQSNALVVTPDWLDKLVKRIKEERAQVISFNWDLVLDELLFGSALSADDYGLGGKTNGPRLVKPHGSLNWYEQHSGSYLKESMKFMLCESGADKFFAFKEYRAPKSTKRKYMPLIVPPVYSKQFHGELFKRLWRETVAILSVASEVRFIGYSLPTADFHARFILRCGFHNQIDGPLRVDGTRASVTGRAAVTIIDPSSAASKRIRDVVGWNCKWHRKTVEEWLA